MAGPILVPLSAKLSELALKRYIETFLDPERMSYHTYLMLEKLRKNKGYRNSGHALWDYFASTRKLRPYIISEDTFRSYAHKLTDVLIYWDSNYVEPNSSYASTNRVCAAHYSDIAASFQVSPRTLYIFDRSFEWTLVRTDEEQNDLGWNCLQIGEIGGAAQKRKQVSAPAISAAPDGDSPPGNLIPLQRKQMEQV